MRLLLFAAAILGLIGCIDRKLFIRTEPPGADVFVNGKLIGTSPVELSTPWSGTYGIEIRKEGFATVSDRKEIISKVYEIFPFDFFAQVIPITINDHREVNYTLIKMSEDQTPEEQVIKNAEELRSRVK